MKKLPLGIQNFNEISKGDYIYVDKTQYIYNLICGAKYYFLSRPRRFGKSLLLDTINEVFGGDRELFKGLWIYDSDYNFIQYPVIKLDMSNIANETPEVFRTSLVSELMGRVNGEKLDMQAELPSDIFKGLIEKLYIKYNKRIVVLIDEYDKPILDHLYNLDIAEGNRQVLRGFYGILKSMDPFLKFTFITGVTKFTKTSIFSGLNNLLDITLTEEYANICGVPADSVESYFSEYIDKLSDHKRFQQYSSIRDEILAWYDGYSWDGETKLLNPFSLLNFFEQKRFAGFWYASGTPGFLPEMIKKKPESYTNIKNFEITEHMLDSADIDKLALEPLLFQTGYLTIKDIQYIYDEPIYILELPNREVKLAFNLHVLSAMTENDDVQTGQMRLGINRALQTGNPQKMLDLLRGFFASIPYELHVDLEAYYHSIFYALMSALGFDLDVEVSVSKSRIDAVLELSDKVYAMEFKYAKCPPNANVEQKRMLFESTLDGAMDQINGRGYADKYKAGDKHVYKAAFAFLGRGDIEMRAEKI